jgi:hypothetical protein
MSDQKHVPDRSASANGTNGTGAKAPADTGARGDQLPKTKPISFMQQVFIWALIIVVGALFGMSGSLAVIQGPQQVHGGVPDNVVTSFLAIDKKLEHILGRRIGLDFDDYVERVKIGREAESEGLKPSGAALEQLVEHFLEEEIAPGRTMRDALNDYRGGENEVTRAELRRKLALEESYIAFIRRHVLAPAVPLTVADGMTALRQDNVQVDEAVLDAAALIKPVAEDDPEIQQAYEKLRATRFTKPEAVTLTVAYADVEALKKQVTIGDADVQAYFDAHKADPDFQKPKAVAAPVPPTPSTEPPKPETEPKTVDEMKPVIVERLQHERVLKLAKEAAAALDADAEAFEGQKDNATFKEAAAKKGLAVKEGVTVEAQPQQQTQYGAIQRSLVLPGLGAMRDQAGLFSRDKEPGFISRAVPIDGPPATFAVVRMESRIPAGFKPLAEVKPEVQKYLQGQRAYKEFIVKAQEARDAAQKLGPGGLAAYLASPAGAVWNVKPTSNTLKPATTLRAPPAEIGQPSPETRVAASLAMPERPVALVEVGSAGADLPKAKLVQARAYEPAKPAAEVASRSQEAQEYRRDLQNYRWRLFAPELQRIKEQK